MKHLTKHLTFIIIAVTLAFMCNVKSYAEEISPYYLHINGISTPLSFSGTTANCSLYIDFDSGTKSVNGTWKLKDLTTGSTVASWYVSKTSSVVASRTATVVSGHKYEASFSGTSYGTDGSSESITCSTTKTCP